MVMSFNLAPHMARLVGCGRRTTASDAHTVIKSLYTIFTIIAFIQWTFYRIVIVSLDCRFLRFQNYISFIMMGNWLSFHVIILNTLIKDTFFSKFYDNNINRKSNNICDYVLLHEILFFVSEKFYKKTKNIEVNLATFSFGDIAGFKTVVSVCLSDM